MKTNNQDRVTDNRAQFFMRWHDYMRGHTPRQRKLQARRRALLAQYHETLSAIAGGILLVVVIICLFFI